MAYTIIKSNGQVLTTIADGTINTSASSLALPGRNYAGYGQYLDTNMVHILESFANVSPPANPLQGQLWYNTNTNTLNLCPADGTTNASAWLTLTTTSSSGTTTFGSVTVTGNLQANNINVTNGFTGDTITVRLATVTSTATIATANITTANLGTTNTTTITTGGTSTNGVLTGTWTANGSGTANSISGTSLWVTGGNLVISGGSPALGIRTDNYYYANGTPVSFAGTYTNGNVYDYLTGSNGISRFSGAISV